MEIRDALPGDADTASEVLRRSITELCTTDHGNDAEMLARWLRNKTPEQFVAWVARPEASVLVAVEASVVVAVGAVTDNGEVTLNYVSPDFRFRGVSRAMLHALEARAVERGNTTCRLFSTETALRFYLANGYSQSGEPNRMVGMPGGFPMSKAFTDARC